MSQFTQAQSSVTTNIGGYDNRIALITPQNNYTEICYKNGNRLNDQHQGGESTEGGNCLPGDIGFIIEQNERTANYWEQAKDTCLRQNMRLLEPFEYKLACVDASEFNLNDMTGNWEWASNFALPMTINSDYYGVGAAIMGGSGCAYADGVGSVELTAPSTRTPSGAPSSFSGDLII